MPSVPSAGKNKPITMLGEIYWTVGVDQLVHNAQTAPRGTESLISNSLLNSPRKLPVEDSKQDQGQTLTRLAMLIIVRELNLTITVRDTSLKNLK